MRIETDPLIEHFQNDNIQINHEIVGENHEIEGEMKKRKEYRTKALCFYMLSWKFAYLVLDALNIIVLLMITNLSENHNNWDYFGVIGILIVIIIYYIILELMYFGTRGKALNSCILNDKSPTEEKTCFVNVILLLIPIVLVFALAVCFRSVLVDEGVVSLYFSKTSVLYGFGGAVLGYSYVIFIVFYPFSLIYPDQVAFFTSCFCCGGVRLFKGEIGKKIRVGCLISLSRNDKQSLKKNSGIRSMNLMFTFILILRVITLGLGSFLFFFIQHSSSVVYYN